MNIIKNGKLVTPTEVIHMDLAIENGKIKAIEKDIIPNEEDVVIDAEGSFICPGFIDGHTHLDMDSATFSTSDDFEAGTKAAVCGGTTTIINFATQNKGDSLENALKDSHKRAENNCYSNYAFHMAITDWNEDVKKEIPNMIKNGITSFKIYLAYDALKLNDLDCMDILYEMKKYGGLLSAHCENGEIANYLINKNLENGNIQPKYHCLSRPSEVEAEAVNRLLYISKIVGYPVQVVHLSSELGLNEIRKARANGQKVLVETCPQYMLLDDTRYELPNFEGAKYVISPPLRKKSDVEEIIEAVKNNEIDTIATDHCSYNFEEHKKLGLEDFSKIPNGAPGVEHRVNLIYTNFVDTGMISINDMVKLLSENPAKQYGMQHTKGKLEVGFDGDIVILQTGIDDTISAKTQVQKVDYTPYEGFKLTSKIKAVLVNGEIAYKDGEISKNKQGKYINRDTI